MSRERQRAECSPPACCGDFRDFQIRHAREPKAHLSVINCSATCGARGPSTPRLTKISASSSSQRWVVAQLLAFPRKVGLLGIRLRADGDIFTAGHRQRASDQSRDTRDQDVVSRRWMIGGFETKNERRRLAVASLRSSTRLSHPAAEQRAHGFARSTLLTFANLPLQRARMAGNVELICPTLQRKSATSWHDGQLEHDAHAR